MTSKEKKRVRWAETDDVFDEASTRAEKAPRLEDQSDGPVARDEAGAVPEPSDGASVAPRPSRA